MSERVLVTGAIGFVGNRLCAYLESEGYEVYSCDLAPKSNNERYRVCDVADPDSIRDTLIWAGPLNYVIHLAAMTFVPEAAVAPEKVINVNVNGTITLIRLMEKLTPEARLLFISSSEVYGAPQFMPVTEEHPFHPNNPYAISKAAADEYCRYYASSGKLSIVRMRPYNHSGPGQSDRFVLSSFAKQVATIESGTGSPVLHVGNLEVARDFMHVDDVIRSYVTALTDAQSGEAYNICSGNAYNIGSALKSLVEMSGTEIQIEVNPDLLRPADIPEIRGSHEKFTNATGWNPEITFELLLHDLLNYWRENL